MKETRDGGFILKKMEGVFYKRPWRRGNRLYRPLDLDWTVEIRSGGGGVTGGELGWRCMAGKAGDLTGVWLFADSGHHWTKQEHKER